MNLALSLVPALFELLVETRVALLAVLGTMQSGPLLLLLLAALSAAEQCGGLGGS